MSLLALFGGEPVVSAPLPSYRSIGAAEVAAVTRVAESGCLSDYYGSWGEKYFGGPIVRELETRWSETFGCRHSVAVNSGSTGLVAAMGAICISPGDEVIVSPYTMSATAMAPLVYGGIPVFADIEPDTFCLDPNAVEAAITSRTRAILVTNLFGHPARLRELRAMAERHGIVLVEDNAQGPMAMEEDRFAGTIGHIGVFSLNYHKHIHCGEGGICVTDDDDLARRMQLIRNHGENAVGPLRMEDITNMVGFNFRLTELSAAVAIEQLKAIEKHVSLREKTGRQLSGELADLDGFIPPRIRSRCRHVYYVWAARIDERSLGVSRARYCEALAAEGFPHFQGYVAPLYRLPLFARRTAIGKNGFPFNLSSVRYSDGSCPVAERMHDSELMGFEPCLYDLDAATADFLVEAVRKVHRNRSALAKA